tara:strand:- start:160 stop:1110 length:951 start_codon:yes stop_codon:yes gene_type:complete
MISNDILGDLKSLNQSYIDASPFPHVMMDNFFEQGAAETLLADFPPFDEERAKNEFGKIGRKSVNKDMPEISEGYAKFCDFLISKDFLKAIEKITGIDNLVALPGGAGGTHESLSGQALAPHIDYNYIDLPDGRKLHRRLNLLFYLNKDWKPEWGGNFEVHSNPRRPAENQFKAFAPDFNRCIIMGTSEKSWHGYDPIVVPKSANASRKSISIYLFTVTRPKDEVAPQHSTFYVQKPISSRFQKGYTLSKADAAELRQEVAKRDQWIEFYQNEILRHSGRANKNADKADWLHRRLKKAEENPLIKLIQRITGDKTA